MIFRLLLDMGEDGASFPETEGAFTDVFADDALPVVVLFVVAVNGVTSFRGEGNDSSPPEEDGEEMMDKFERLAAVVAIELEVVVAVIMLPTAELLREEGINGEDPVVKVLQETRLSGIMIPSSFSCC